MKHSNTAGSVLLVVESCGHGLARHVVELTDGLLQRGWKVGLVYSTTRPTDSTLGTMLRRLTAEQNFQAFHCAMSLWPSLGDIAIVRQILSAISTVKADVVHCHSTKAGFVGRIAAAMAGVPSVYTAHAPLCMNPQLSLPVRAVSSAYEGAFGHLGGAFLALSEEEWACARGVGVPARRIHLVPNGIPLPAPVSADVRAEMRARFGVQAGEVCAGFVGRLCSQKAIDNLLCAWKNLIARGSRVPMKLAIVGDGPLHEELQALGRSLGLGSSVVWTGAFPGAQAMAAFDIFVLPSDYEGMPYVLLEAMAAGLPIVTTEVGGAGMLVAPGVNGWIVPRREPVKLAAALQEMAEDADLRKGMGAASRIRVAEFSVDRMVDGAIGVYDGLLAAGKARAAGSYAQVRTSPQE